MAAKLGPQLLPSHPRWLRGAPMAAIGIAPTERNGPELRSAIPTDENF